MKFFKSSIGVCFLGILFFVLAGCSSSPEIDVPPFESALYSGDYHVNWALAYFESWKREHQPRYLFLTRDHTISAIEIFYELQNSTSPAIREFYIVRGRRNQSCRMLMELELEAQSFGHALGHEVSEECQAY